MGNRWRRMWNRHRWRWTRDRHRRRRRSVCLRQQRDSIVKKGFGREGFIHGSTFYEAKFVEEEGHFLTTKREEKKGLLYKVRWLQQGIEDFRRRGWWMLCRFLASRTDGTRRPRKGSTKQSFLEGSASNLDYAPKRSVSLKSEFINREGVGAAQPCRQDHHPRPKSKSKALTAPVIPHQAMTIWANDQPRVEEKRKGVWTVATVPRLAETLVNRLLEDHRLRVRGERRDISWITQIIQWRQKMKGAALSSLSLLIRSWILGSCRRDPRNREERSKSYLTLRTRWSSPNLSEAYRKVLKSWKSEGGEKNVTILHCCTRMHNDWVYQEL